MSRLSEEIAEASAENHIERYGMKLQALSMSLTLEVAEAEESTENQIKGCVMKSVDLSIPTPPRLEKLQRPAINASTNAIADAASIAALSTKNMTNLLRGEASESSDDDSIMESYLSKLPPEQTLRVGDSVEYHDSICVVRDKRGHMMVMVLTVHCRGQTKLVLGTGDTLPKTWFIKGTHTFSEDGTRLIDGYKPG